jgi:uridine kinase
MEDFKRDCTFISFSSSQVLGPKEHELAEQNEYNFDHPDAFDFDLLIKTLRRLKAGKKVEVPIYNFVSHSREKQSVNIIQMRKTPLGFP